MQRQAIKIKLTAALLGIVFAWALTSFRYMALDSLTNIFNLVETVESAEFFEIAVEEDPKIISSEHVHFPFFKEGIVLTSQITGNTTTVSFVPDIPPELS
jgi:hypothetical protein